MRRPSRQDVRSKRRVRETLTEVARERRAALLGEINAFSNELRARYGQMSDSTPLIREIREDEIG